MADGMTLDLEELCYIPIRRYKLILELKNTSRFNGFFNVVWIRDYIQYI